MPTYTLDIAPIPKQEIRVGRYGAYKSKKLVDYQEQVSMLLFTHPGVQKLDGPIKMSIEFYLKRPKSAKSRKYPEVRPDLDNFCKAAADSCTGILFHDDGQIVDLTLKKRYHEKAHIVISVDKL